MISHFLCTMQVFCLIYMEEISLGMTNASPMIEPGSFIPSVFFYSWTFHHATCQLLKNSCPIGVAKMQFTIPMLVSKSNHKLVSKLNFPLATKSMKEDVWSTLACC
ncbi:hypothetical protein Ahy_A02g004925 isoform C [Arachis hypogaea]|uniref:Uncharacterized protein n=1 Tax=Arachis hypogaea TaxID=3818 RepID=A0A445E555_ARAHY|nr:hypothetical protein Ahy_A02g004925 isoform C [Arachis hypogaea]